LSACYGYKLLRGADFDKKGAVDDALRIERFDTLKAKLPDVLDVHTWHEFLKAIMNAGYLSGDMILSGNAIFYSYALYLIAKHRFNASYNENMHLTSLWFFYASLVAELTRREKNINEKEKILYVYEDEIAVTFTYTEDKRSLNIKNSQELIDIRQNIMDLLNDHTDRSGMSADEVKEYLGVCDEDPPDFFRLGVRR